MTDWVDHAQRLEEAERAAALQRVLDNVKASEAKSRGVHHTCTKCGDSIPPARRVVMPGADLCVECASELEGYGR